MIDSPFGAGRERARDFGAATAGDKAYCRVHELLATVDARADDGFAMDRTSAYVRGDFTAPGGAMTRFEGRVGLRGGALVELGDGPRPEGGKGIVVTVVRAPARAFDGVKLEGMTPSEVAYAFLRGLAKGTRAEVLPEVDGGGEEASRLKEPAHAPWGVGGRASTYDHAIGDAERGPRR
jgi:hypothetical protein